MKISWKLQSLFRAMGHVNLMASSFPASQERAYGYHVMNSRKKRRKVFLQIPTNFYMQKSCGVVEIPFPTKTAILRPL